jgi:sulfite reductase alpha subunit-like flavoprotein
MMATYGEGDPTDNAITFMKWLGKHAEKNSLAGLRYAVHIHMHPTAARQQLKGEGALGRAVGVG